MSGSHRAVLALVRRDLTVVRRSGPLVAPIVIVPVVFALVLPLLLALVPRLARGPASVARAAEMLAAVSPALRAELAGLSSEQAMVVLMTVHLLAPLFLLLPFLVANVIAADSIAGERERKTLEALLYTPLTDGELFLAKTLVALVPALLVTVASFALYSVVVNAAAWPVMHRIFFPTALWYVLVVFVAPAVALLGIAAMVIVSMRVKGVQEAVQLSGLLVLPIIALVISQVRGGVFLGPRVLALIGAALWLVALALLRYGMRSFRRERLIRES